MVDISNQECLNTSNTINKDIKVLSSNDSMKVSNKFNSAQFSNTSVIKCGEITDADNDVYNNLVMRYTLDNFFTKVRNKYLECLSLEP
ncbi:hypothetical protein WH47_02522 [Habropoda laboriosa]|uniref:Uncharacterized protein n=2 Tax=Habropoda laboriosa TaxID=597456 RepID=A0A0L7QW82_9HYME|nr:hypothetical protein WH47_02522 [Habropoda laboriosa]